MNILLISSPNKLGAGRIPFVLMDGLRDSGHKVNICTPNYINESGVKSIKVPSKLYDKIRRKFKNIFYPTDKNYHFFDIKTNSRNNYSHQILKKTDFKPDVIIIVFYQNFINYRNILELASETEAPILFWMMDMVAFTGGCHYSLGCFGYQTNCLDCPALLRNKQIANSNLVFNRSVLKKINVYALAVSNYQLRQAKLSSNFKNIKTFLFPLAVDKSFFENANLKAPMFSQRNVLFCASNLDENRKGFIHLIKALKSIDLKLDKRIVLNLVGSYTEKVKESYINIDICYLGSLSSTIQISKLFSGSYCLIVPTLADSGPTIIMESISCGTPVVTYRMGVAEDYILDGITGYVANLGDVEDLARKILLMLNIDISTYEKMRTNCFETANSRFSQNRQIERINEILLEIQS